MNTDTVIQEQELAAEEEEKREVDIARGNPLLNSQDFNMKRRWDDDVVFKNQSRGSEKKDGQEFVNVWSSPDEVFMGHCANYHGYF